MKHARTAGADILARLLHGVADVVVDGMSTTQRVMVGGVAGALALAPFGAWEPVTAEPEPLVTGEAIEVGPLEVKVLRAVAAQELAYLEPQEGNRLLAVVVDVTNTGEAPVHSVMLATAIPAPPGAGIVTTGMLQERATIFAVEDATYLDIVNPGLTYRAALVWEQSGEAAGDAITLDVLELTWIEEDFTGLDDDHWTAYGDVALRGRLAVETGVDG